MQPGGMKGEGTDEHQTLPITVMAFYKFSRIDDLPALQTNLKMAMEVHHMKGAILIASEGINGTIAGPAADAALMLEVLRSIPGFSTMTAKISRCKTYPFLRTNVKIKKEIVTMGQPDLDLSRPGEYIAPKDWNALISNPDVLIVDTRNDYEVDIGSFRGAENPDTVRFRDFPAYVKERLDEQKHRKIAMFCTGGIRCEKSTAYLRSQGFDSVYHLQGGILQYLEDVPEEDSLWEGDCFVFDERVAVNHQLAPAGYIQCYACRGPLKPADTKRPEFVEGESCHRCFKDKSPENRARFRERQKQIDLARSRGESHLGSEAELKRRRCDSRQATEASVTS